MRLLAVTLALAAAAYSQTPNTIAFDGLSRSNPAPAFDHGYVAAWDLVQVHSLTLYDPSGARLFDLTSLTLPDGTRTYTPDSVDIDSDGISAYTWRAMFPRAGFALLDKTGKPLRIVETQPYAPSQICFAPDHSLWVFGQLWGPKTLEPDYPVFRHYSRDGKLLGAFVQRSTLPTYDGIGLDNLTGSFVGLWRLRASKDRLGAALLLGNGKSLWVELDFSGNLIGQWPLPHGMPLAFDENNTLYGGYWSEDHHHYRLLVFDKSTGTWQPLPPHPPGLLIAADGTRLVYQNGDQLRWTDPPAPLTQSASLAQPR
ncbi:MAG TPA: hypothetical protein VKX25_13960 [Bryobacteraceae bacterium]|jgi:hypothetical protein|nr:hypothetical protein [Bryobacteraceae bacterium]